jgi:hypothetical protein
MIPGPRLSLISGISLALRIYYLATLGGVLMPEIDDGDASRISAGSKLKSIFKGWKLNVVVLSAYTALVAIFTYPVVFSAEMLPGARGDTFWFLWDFWWFKKVLLDHSAIYYTNYIFYPSGVSLVSSGLTQLNAAASVPLQLALGLVDAYKLIWLLTFLLSGFGAFLLVRYLTGDVRAAFIAGIIFAFCPYRFAHGLEGHIDLISTQWIPLYILFLMKTMRESKGSNALFAAFFLFLTAMSSYYYLVYLFIFTALYIFYYGWSHRSARNWRTIRRIAMIALPFGLISLPFLYPVLKDLYLTKADYAYVPGFVEYSADLLGYFTPSRFHPIFKDLADPIFRTFTGNWSENTVFVGYVTIFLSLLATFKARTSEIRFWAFSALFYFILSLGPLLHLKGLFSFNCEGYSVYIPLPYSFLMQIPIFSLARIPSRWDIMLMLCLTVLAGYGLKYILGRLGATSGRSFSSNVAFILAICLISFEFLSIPLPMSSAEVPLFYRQIADDRDDYAILEVPDVVFMRWHSRTFPDYMYYQSVHGKKIVNGYVSRQPYYANGFLATAPLISELMFNTPSLNAPSAKVRDILEQNLTGLGDSIMNEFNIRYLIIHKDRLTLDQFAFASSLLNRSLVDAPRVYENDSMIIYRARSGSIKPFLMLGSGWNDPDNMNSTAMRWMGDEATLFIYASENSTAILSQEAISFNCARTLKIYINDTFKASQEISPSSPKVVNVSLGLNKGRNLITLRVDPGCKRPSDVLNSFDKRCLSIEIKNMTLIY